MSGATPLSSFTTQIHEALGKISLLKEIIISEKRCILIEGMKNNVTTVVLCDISSQRVQETENLCKSVLNTLVLSLQYPYLVSGGGTCEFMLSYYVRQKAHLMKQHKLGIFGLLQK